MPEIDGFELIKTVRELSERSRHTLQAIAITAYMGREVRERALAAGFDAFARKPLDPDELVKAIQRLRQMRNSRSIGT